MILAAALACAIAVLMLPGRGMTRRALLPQAHARGLAATCTRWKGRWRAHRRASDAVDARDDELPALLDVLAPSLRAGRTPAEAVDLACSVVRVPLADDLRRATRAGIPLDTVIATHARSDAAVRFFGQAWQLSATIGCPLAQATEVAGRGARARLDHRRHVESATAGSRATVRVLAVLPLAGPLLAMAVGVDPVETYLASPPTWVALAAGVVLVVVGHRWVTASVARAVRGPVLGPSPACTQAGARATGGTS